MNIKARDRYVEFRRLPKWTYATGENARDPHKWSGKNPPPPIGEKVRVIINDIGPGTITGYFAQHGWLGVLVKLDSPPAWWLEQNPTRPDAHLFGIELESKER